uniref:rRNA biogenesis protein RRP36 n=1 Tax=Saccoglossus kowalevskii TaxID=10224 RepID=A0ABM0MFA9_SACKO|nr:PREDICTED: ribosomal RNA processing protein 36 homolog isoform X2 [Saccoglossus kowalevskii]
MSAPVLKLETMEDDSDSDWSEDEHSGNEDKQAADPELQIMAAIRNELSEVTFEELQKLKERVGTKVYKEAILGKNKTTVAEARKKKFKRDNKNRPREMSSKIPVSRYREIIPVKKQVQRDPRFDDLSGQYKEEVFNKRYDFLKDIKMGEKKLVEKKLRKTKSTTRKEELKALMQRMKDDERSQKQREQIRAREMEHKQKIKGYVKEGKNPYFLKKCNGQEETRISRKIQQS